MLVPCIVVEALCLRGQRLRGQRDALTYLTALTCSALCCWWPGNKLNAQLEGLFRSIVNRAPVSSRHGWQQSPHTLALLSKVLAACRAVNRNTLATHPPLNALTTSIHTDVSVQDSVVAIIELPRQHLQIGSDIATQWTRPPGHDDHTAHECHRHWQLQRLRVGHASHMYRVVSHCRCRACARTTKFSCPP